MGNAKRGVYPRLKIWPGDLDLWPMTMNINRAPDSLKDEVCTKCGQNTLKDIDSRVFTRMLHVKIWSGDLDLWPITLKINMVPDSLKDEVCTKFGQTILKDIDSRLFRRMLRSKNVTRWPWPLTNDIENQMSSRVS